ncbi:MAG: ABC transporter permease [Candidatus Lokiarchaeota archaeon]|nr:ABC transporter permease [Candidatus Lokiarchaeota archaeon]
MTEQAFRGEIPYKQSESPTKKKFFRFLKFYLIPGWREPEFSSQEYHIEKIKSKRRMFRRLINPLTILGIIMLLFILVLAVYSPWLTRYRLDELVIPYIPPDTNPFDIPSAEHPLGTTKYGYDILARIIWGGRTTILMALIPVTIATVGGLILGTISAYFGGTVDYLMMRFVDLMYSFPNLILVIIIVPILGQELLTSLVIYGILFIPYNIRFMRSLVLQVKQLEYIQAAKTGGAKKFRVMFKHIIPNAISPMIIAFFGGAAVAVLGLAGLAFIGLGDPLVASWGTDINWARATFSNPNAAFWPGLLIGITSIGFILLGDGVRDALDPRLSL